MKRAQRPSVTSKYPAPGTTVPVSVITDSGNHQKLITMGKKTHEEAEKSWRRINGVERIELLLKGVTFKDGEAVQDNPPLPQNLAA